MEKLAGARKRKAAEMVDQKPKKEETNHHQRLIKPKAEPGTTTDASRKRSKASHATTVKSGSGGGVKRKANHMEAEMEDAPQNKKRHHSYNNHNQDHKEAKKPKKAPRAHYANCAPKAHKPTNTTGPLRKRVKASLQPRPQNSSEKPEPKPEPKSESKPELKPESQLELYLKPQSKPGPELKLELKPELELEAELKPESEPEPEFKAELNPEPLSVALPRNLKDVWKAAFLVGTRWDELDSVSNKFNWVDFSNLERALLYDQIIKNIPNNNSNQNVYMFVQLDPASCSDPSPVPAVVAVASPIPPSREIAITSIQGAAEQIVPMEQLSMDWIPYNHYHLEIDHPLPQIFVLGFTKTKAALMEQIMMAGDDSNLRRLEYCLPYVFDPEKEKNKFADTFVDLFFPREPNAPLHCVFDWKADKCEEFTDEMIEDEELSADRKDEFMEFIKEKVGHEKKRMQEEKEVYRKRKEELSEEDKWALENMKLYKFFPLQTPDAPLFTKSKSINRYFGNAHELL